MFTRRDKTALPTCRVKVGLERRPAEEERGRQALARWQATLATEEISEGIRKEEREAVTKLEVLLKVSRDFCFCDPHVSP